MNIDQFSAVVNLQSMILFSRQIQDDPFGIGSNLLSYLARPRIFTKVFKHKECYEGMFQRRPADQMGTLGFAPADTQAFVRKFNLLNTDNEYYRLAVKMNPTAEDLEKASYIQHGYATLWAIKLYNLHHMHDVGRFYRGFQPFGGPVKAYVNNLEYPINDVSGPSLATNWHIKGTPSYSDHVILQTITNLESDSGGKPPVTINTEMHLVGRELRKKNAATEGTWVDEDSTV